MTQRRRSEHEIDQVKTLFNVLSVVFAVMAIWYFIDGIYDTAILGLALSAFNFYMAKRH